MKSILLLFICGASWVSAQDSGQGLARFGLASARVDSHQIRMNTLDDQIGKLEGRVNSAIASNLGQAAANLAARIGGLEGNKCGDQFACGGDTRQCVNHILVCDGSNDCGNGADESSDVCTMRAPAGSSWEGAVNWQSCRIFSNQVMRVVITGNRRMDFYRSRVDVSATVTFSQDERSGQRTTRTFPTTGYYMFGRRALVLLPVQASDLRVGIRCFFNSDSMADCQLVQESTLALCANVRVNRN